MRKHLAAILWTVAFLGVTLTAVVAELVAVLDHSNNTQPWTWYISHYVPWPVALGAYVALAAWLPFHFWVNYHRAKRAETALRLIYAGRARSGGHQTYRS